MYLRISKREIRGRMYEYAQIVEGKRIKGEVKIKMIKSLGRINNPEELKRAKEFLERIKRERNPFLLFKASQARTASSYGLIYLLKELFREYGFFDLFGNLEIKAKFDFSWSIFLLIANRLSSPASELSMMDWLETIHLEKEKPALHHFYRSLDHLIKNKEKIEKAILEKIIKEKLKIKPRIVFYDLTSSYFEGNCSDLAEYGYSRDKKKGKKQLVLGLVLIENYPVASFVYKGNTTDKKTLKQTIDYLKKDLSLKEIIFIADRGLISEENIDFLQKENLEFIIATKRRIGKEIREFIRQDIEKSYSQKEKNLFVKELAKDNNQRYILCFNKEKGQKDLKELEENVNQFVSQLKSFYKKRKKFNQNKIQSLRKSLGIYSSFFELKESSFSINQDKFQFERDICGKFILATNTKYSPLEVCQRYKQLNKIENAFRVLKSSLNLRPFYHRDEKRIKAHIFVCLLTLLIKRLIEDRLKNQTDSFLKKIEEHIRVIRITDQIRNIDAFVLTEIPLELQKQLNLLGIKVPPKAI